VLEIDSFALWLELTKQPYARRPPRGGARNREDALVVRALSFRR